NGGAFVTKRILDLIENHGAYIAEQGEFTKRAFLNGRIDLPQAEAVMDLISAKNEYAAKSSINQLKGRLHDEIKDIRNELFVNSPGSAM
ncbi:MAG: tRNA uridine-5-carboxymethylaminomethyl(34) synthesis GTPase MnmE, partial [Lachnospiraceae bacterium]|nr:tRNA uridine-5-carboxymethylaminomethyl(34) synthesis GTPase MnmE [Lachnospiraceae bacterium]